jgi:proteasome lid subunit RPN8/RPN11
VLAIGREILDAIIAHARRDHPEEACGIVAGPQGSDRPARHIPMDNADRSMTFFRFDSAEQLRVWREMDARDEEPIVIYHSHTATPAYPSRTDIDIAGYPEAHYLLVSTRDPGTAEVRSFRIRPAAGWGDGDSAGDTGVAGDEVAGDKQVTEERVQVIDASVDPAAVTTYMFGQSPATVDYECSAPEPSLD